jgi:UDP-N-acetylglucosamine--N-acetylmuramyl-(pentapeptide) pyrophosphoryl-undecaprenol N-acetylglucosamine transferase
MKLVIAGGGTGGHLFPGLALAEELLARGSGHSVLFLGSRGGIEERILPLHSYRYELLPSLKGGFFNFSGPSKLWLGCRGYLQARRSLLNFNADAVVGLGGYASALPVLAAWGIEVPRLIIELNVIPSKTNRYLAAFSDEISAQFPECAKHFSKPLRVRHMGNPLRKKILDAAKLTVQRNTSLRETPAEPTLLVIGGSQGAKALNDIAIKAWPRLKQAVPGIRMILVAGREDEQRCVEAFAAHNIRGSVVGFVEAMEDLYIQADVVLARSGAASLAEIAAFSLPSILIPYPHAADDHQVENAKVYAERGAGWMMIQKEVEVERLAQRVADAVLQPERRRKMSVAAHSLAMLDAARDTADRLIEMGTGMVRAGAGTQSKSKVPSQIVRASEVA